MLMCAAFNNADLSIALSIGFERVSLANGQPPELITTMATRLKEYEKPGVKCFPEIE